jgi:hypothetical protein
VTLINTKGMAFFGPGSEWFWAALQFTALAVTFVAIYRQVRIARGARAVEQVEKYSTQYGSERMHRHRLAIFIAVRDGMEIPVWAASTVGDFFETLAWLSRSGDLDIKLLWNALGHSARIWWTVLEPFISSARAETGTNTYADWEWLIGRFVQLSRRAEHSIAFDAAWVANQLPQLIENNQQAIRVEQALRSVVIASPEDPYAAHSAAAAPVPPPNLTAENEKEHQVD